MRDRDLFIQYFDALKWLARQMESAVQNCATEIAADSPATRELATFHSPPLVETAFGQGTMLSVVVRDHFEGLIRSLTEPVLTIAPWSNARSTLESAALSCWLLDPTIDARERVSRSFAFRYEGQCQQLTLAKVTGNTAVIAKTTARIETINEDAKALGYAEVLDKKGKKRIGIGQRMPSLTSLADTVLGSGDTYKVFSSVVHAHPWALQQLGFQPMSDEAGRPKTIPGQAGDLYLFQKGFPVMAIKLVAAEVGSAFCETHLREWKLFGRDVGVVEEIRDRFEQQLQA